MALASKDTSESVEHVLYRKPSRATFVRKLELLGSHNGYAHYNYFKEGLPAINFEGWYSRHVEALHKATEVPHEVAYEWRAKLAAGNVDAYVALLVSQLPNLRCLALGPPYSQRAEFVGMLFSLVRRAQHGEKTGVSTFLHLKEVTFEPNYNFLRLRHNVKMTDTALQIFFLPHLEKLSVSFDVPVGLIWPNGANLVNPQTITSLELNMVRERHLTQILRLTPKLRSLHWEMFYTEYLDNPACTTTVNLDAVATALENVRATVEDLVIKCYVDRADSFGEPALSFEGSLRPLARFHYLYKLQAEPMTLAASFQPTRAIPLKEILPQSLKTLAITDYLAANDSQEWHDEHIFHCIAEWVRDESAPKPNLRAISYVDRDFCGPGTRPDPLKEKLEEFCRAHSLELLWKKIPPLR
ncbi:hypothetical protein EJ08DRAFT_695427 [Tothia fuscella]|uniref:Uncharacterized protein n=1 Tax=Tothia fuscella TaxID=1048955 RepID=A0A9P4NV87_9PEZI|nr:hypothetical protein EJ08DRAFT_695427 [Tothia fuscella]